MEAKRRLEIIERVRAGGMNEIEEIDFAFCRIWIGCRLAAFERNGYQTFNMGANERGFRVRAGGFRVEMPLAARGGGLKKA